MMHARRKECAAWHIHPLRIDHIPMNIPRNCTRSPTITGGPNRLRCCGTFNGICLCFNGIQRGMVQRPAKMVALVILPACFLAGQVARQAGPICASAIFSGAYSRVRVLVLVCVVTSTLSPKQSVTIRKIVSLVAVTALDSMIT